MAHFLVTGAAGFIGNALAIRLIERGDTVVGVDNLNDYYDVQLKRDRLARIQSPRFSFQQVNLADRRLAEQVFSERPYDVVLNMAAQAGVRYSLTDPHAYVDSNLTAFVNLLEGCRRQPPVHLVYASSSSVYGANRDTPFTVGDAVDRPLNLYAATKRANELMAYSYSHLYCLPTTGLRFFTVYGPWGRPDMALYKFADAISRGLPIDVYNHGQMRRDFTYIDDIVEGVLRVAVQPPVATLSGAEGPTPPYALYNIGNHTPIVLERLIAALETSLGRKAIRRNCEMQPGDMLETCADVGPLEQAVGFRPATTIEAGVAKFVEWFLDYKARPKSL